MGSANPGLLLLVPPPSSSFGPTVPVFRLLCLHRRSRRLQGLLSRLGMYECRLDPRQGCASTDKLCGLGLTAQSREV